MFASEDMSHLKMCREVEVGVLSSLFFSLMVFDCCSTFCDHTHMVTVYILLMYMYVKESPNISHYLSTEPKNLGPLQRSHWILDYFMIFISLAALLGLYDV